jgi:small GTP-binding protein
VKFTRLTADDYFSIDYTPTTGVDVTVKRITIDNQEIKLFLWDTAGQEVFNRIRPMYFEGSTGCIIIFDKQEVDYERNITYWVKEYKKTVHSPSIPIVIVGITSNKDEEIDLEAKRLAAQWNATYFETTITDKEMINHILVEMADLIVKNCQES